jgi:repressor LexA
MKGLSPRQKDVLEAICHVVDREGRFPTVRELARLLGVSSPATISQHLRALVRKGYLEKSGFHYVLPPTSRAPRAHAIPVVGRVAAGEPITSEEHIEDWLHLGPPAGPDREGVFAVRVMGDSMVGEGILEGDYVLVDPTREIPNGAVVVAYVGPEQEVTVKRFVRRPDGVELQPANPAYRPLRIPQDDPHFRLAGRVVGLVRRF